MHIYVMDVEHGNCVALMLPSGHIWMVDCGHNGSTGWRPSDWLVHNELALHILTVSNLDEDHVTDLPNIHKHCKPDRFRTNWHLDPDWVRREKQKVGGPGPGIEKAITYMGEYTSNAKSIEYGIDKQYFCHGADRFTDFNNLSVVSFCRLGGFGIVLPGDLEAAGWRAHLDNRNFQACLASVKVFIASHHGRENGFCEEVFDYCSPDVVIVSDKSIEYGTQEGVIQRYGNKVGDIAYDGRSRSVLTTRNDGAIHIRVESNGDYSVTPFK